MPPEQRTDADDIDDVDDDDDTDEAVDDAAARASRRARQQEKRGKAKTDDTDDDDDDLDVDDDTVAEWLNQVTSTPEVQAVIRKASRDIAAKSTDKAVAEVRAELEADFDKRIKAVEARLAKGTITEDEADEEAKKAAEAAARAAARSASEDNDEDKKRQSAREEQLRQRELQAYRREVLATEKGTPLVEEVIVIGPKTTEDDIDTMVEDAKDLYAKIRRSVVKELRAQGWKSPRDVQREATTSSDNPADDDDDDDDDDTAPPTRDAKTRGLGAGRKRSLRERFNYADPAGVAGRRSARR